MTKSKIISVSLLSADFMRLEAECQMVNGSEAQWIHLDVMDGIFVPNITFGMPLVAALRKYTDKVLDTHLMVDRPERFISQFRDAGADFLTIHIESQIHLHRTIQSIKHAGMRAGVALNPGTPVGALEEVIAELDLVLVMSVNPGFGGQKFIESSVAKVQKLRELVVRSGSRAMIEIDGGVNPQNAPILFDAGCDALVAGHSIFSSADPVATIAQMLHGSSKN
jgi:ribulose-phosphate 3-epimerase